MRKHGWKSVHTNARVHTGTHILRGFECRKIWFSPNSLLLFALPSSRPIANPSCQSILSFFSRFHILFVELLLFFTVAPRILHVSFPRAYEILGPNKMYESPWNTVLILVLLNNLCSGGLNKLKQMSSHSCDSEMDSPPIKTSGDSS